MRLWVGLGNPGATYAGHRHNVGFMAMDRLAAAQGAGWRAKFRGQVAEARFGSGRVWLLKPGTFMNLSGQSVGEAMRFHKLEPGDVTVFHDELDLAPGRVKLKAGGGHAGHNGLRSIHQHIGPDYGRVRLGIGHPGHKDRVSGHVLSDFARAEAEMLDDLLRGIEEGAALLAAGDGPGFLNAVARRTVPQRPSGGAAAAPGRSAQDRSSAPEAAREGRKDDPGSDGGRPDGGGGAEGPPPEGDAAGARPRPGRALTPLQRLAARFR